MLILQGTGAMLLHRGNSSQELLVQVSQRPRNFRKITCARADFMIRPIQLLLGDSHRPIVQDRGEAGDTLASEPWTFSKGFFDHAARGHASSVIQVELPYRSARSVRRVNSFGTGALGACTLSKDGILLWRMEVHAKGGGDDNIQLGGNLAQFH